MLFWGWGKGWVLTIWPLWGFINLVGSSSPLPNKGTPIRENNWFFQPTQICSECSETGTVPFNDSLLTGTVPVNNSLLTETWPLSIISYWQGPYNIVYGVYFTLDLDCLAKINDHSKHLFFNLSPLSPISWPP